MFRDVSPDDASLKARHTVAMSSTKLIQFPATTASRRARPEIGKQNASQKREPSPPGVVENFPVLPLRDIVVFPHMIVPLFVGREKSIARSKR